MYWIPNFPLCVNQRLECALTIDLTPGLEAILGVNNLHCQITLSYLYMLMHKKSCLWHPRIPQLLHIKHSTVHKQARSVNTQRSKKNSHILYSYTFCQVKVAYKSCIVSYEFRGLMFNQGVVLLLILLLFFSGFTAAKSYLVLGSVALINTGIIQWVCSVFALYKTSRSDWTSYWLGR